MKFDLLFSCCLLCFILKSAGHTETLQEPIQIQGTGVTNTAVGSIALEFYIILFNPGPSLATIQITFNTCCIDEDKDQKECKVMKLYGGYTGDLTVKQAKHITLIYPTLYPYDMAGSCILYLKMKNVTEIVTIPFNTTLEYKNPVSWLPQFLNEFLFDILIPKPCKSKDEDRFNNCSPVLCDVKYHGHRNYFDPVTRLCTDVPECPGSGSNPPLMVYDDETRTCKNVSQSGVVTETERNLLSLSPPDFKDLTIIDWKTERRLDCNHGYHVLNRSTCICDPGWESLVLPEHEVDPTFGLLQMCNRGKKGYWKHFVVGIIFSIFIIMLFQLSYVLCSRQKRRRRRYREQSPQISPIKSGCFQTLHNQYDPRQLTSSIEVELHEYERKGIVTRLIYRLYSRITPAKEKKLDFSMEEISVGTTLLSPVSMDESYEIN